MPAACQDVRASTTMSSPAGVRSNDRCMPIVAARPHDAGAACDRRAGTGFWSARDAGLDEYDLAAAAGDDAVDDDVLATRRIEVVDREVDGRGGGAGIARDAARGRHPGDVEQRG